MTATKPIEIKVDMTSDSICPFCYIGKRKMDKAIDMAKERGLNVTVERKMHPFLLDPTLTPDSARDKRTHYINKFGEQRFLAMEKAMTERAKKDGINMSYGGKVSQTTDSHRLLSYAYDKGGEDLQNKLAEKLFNGYFEQEQDIGNRTFLASATTAAGVFPCEEEAKAWLKTNEKQEEVEQEILKAQQMGITGVPFFVFDNKYAVSGAQDAELLCGVFERIAKEKTAAKK